MTNKLKKCEVLSRVAMALMAMLLMPLSSWAQEAKIYSGFTADNGSASIYASADENYSKLIDGKFVEGDWTKWCTNFQSTPSDETGSFYWVDFHAEEPIGVEKYILTTGNDNSIFRERNPRSWVLKGKLNENDAWKTIATVSNDTVLKDVDLTNFEFQLDNPGIYKYFRFMISETQGAFDMQLSELRFKAPADTKSLSSAIVTGVNSYYSYGEEAKLSPVITAFGCETALKEGVDYVVELRNGNNEIINKTNGEYIVKDKGEYTFTFTAISGSGYTGVKTVKFAVKEKFSITIPTNIEHGTITCSKTEAHDNELISLSISWDNGYELANELFSITYEDSLPVKYQSKWHDNSISINFYMPAANVSVNAVIRKYTYPIFTSSYGSAFEMIADKERASCGDTVTLSINKEDNVVIDEFYAFYYKEHYYNSEIKKLNKRMPDDDEIELLELTKIDDTHYTFIMPDHEVSVIAKIHLTGKYAINLADGLTTDIVRITNNNIDCDSSDASEIVDLTFNTSNIEDFSIKGADNSDISFTQRFDRDYSFVMPDQPVTISAKVKYLINCRNYDIENCEISIDTEGKTDISHSHCVTLGEKITIHLTPNSPELILSKLKVIQENSHNNNSLPLTYVNDNTYTFIMPASDVSIQCYYGKPLKLKLLANNGTGTMDSIIVADRFYMPECMFTAPEGCVFAGWKPVGYDFIALPENYWSSDNEEQSLIAMWSTNVDFVDEEGIVGNTDAFLMTGEEDSQITNGWYVVRNSNTDANINNGVDIIRNGGYRCQYGSFNLILCDDAEMTMDDTFTTYECKLNIFGQSKGNGKLTISANGTAIDNLWSNMTINGGTISVNSEESWAIHTFDGLIINGGSLTACSKSSDAIYGSVILAANKPTDTFLAKSPNDYYCVHGSVTIAPNISYIGNDVIYENMLSPDQVKDINGVTLAPYSTTTSLNSVSQERVQSDNWYTLDGRKLMQKPAAPGMYIHRGQKVVISNKH